jgi:hypothetical protein
MRKVLCGVMCFAVFYGGCAGRQANPVPAYLPGDENRSCQGLQAEMAQLQSDMQRILPDTNKFATNTLWAAAGFVLIVPFFFMDLKDAEKIEWEAMRVRYNRLLIYAAEKGCDFGVAGAPGRIRSIDEMKELQKDAQKQQKTEETKKESK